MISSIIFDIGNVLLRFDYGRAIHEMRLYSGVPVEEAAEHAVPLVHSYERGELGRDEFLSRLAQVAKYNGTADSLARIWSDIFTPNDPMLALVRSLAPRCPLYLISNTSDLHIEFVRATYPEFALFRDAVYSYEIGRLKPDPEVFGEAVRKFGVEPRETIYIDDLAPNVESARAAGFVAYHYHPDHHAAFDAWLAEQPIPEGRP
jgi:putative hydrolase of the HAD superfamily